MPRHHPRRLDEPPAAEAGQEIRHWGGSTDGWRHRAMIAGVELTEREHWYVCALADGAATDLTPAVRSEVSAAIERKLSEARVPFSELLRVMGLGELELAAALARGCQRGEDRDRAFFLRILQDRARLERQPRRGGGLPLRRPARGKTDEELEDEPATDLSG